MKLHGQAGARARQHHLSASFRHGDPVGDRGSRAGRLPATDPSRSSPSSDNGAAVNDAAGGRAGGRRPAAAAAARAGRSRRPGRPGRLRRRRPGVGPRERAPSLTRRPTTRTTTTACSRRWLKRTHDNYERIAEQTAAGPRVYYFAPGATQPFYVQASDYGYGFQGGALVAVYDSHGHQLAQPAVAQQADMAGRFLQRAHALQQGAQQQPHQNGPPPNWNQQRDALDAQSSHLTQGQQSNPDWQAYHAQHGASDATQWAADQVQRLVQASQADRAMHDDTRADHDWQAAHNLGPHPPSGGPPQAGGPPSNAPPGPAGGGGPPANTPGTPPTGEAGRSRQPRSRRSGSWRPRSLGPGNGRPGNGPHGGGGPRQPRARPPASSSGRAGDGGQHGNGGQPGGGNHGHGPQGPQATTRVRTDMAAGRTLTTRTGTEVQVRPGPTS